MLRAELGDLPAGKIAVHPIQEGGIRPHFHGKRIKQTGGFQQHIHALIDVANKDHRCGSSLRFLTADKGAGSHVILHDLDAVLVLEADTGHLVKGNAVPKTHKTDGFAAHIVEQVGNGGLSAGNQNAVGRDLLIEVRFTRAAGA